MRKICFIGLGRVAKEAIKDIVSSVSISNIHFTFIVREKVNLFGYMLDLRDYLCVIDKEIFYSISDDLSDIRNSDLVIITAGISPTTELKNDLFNIDPSGRLAQTYANYRMISQLGTAINTYCPNTTVLVVTNHADLLSVILRKSCPAVRVIGLGCILDTIRFKRFLFNDLMDRKFKNISISLYSCGIHDENVFIIKDSLHISVENNAKVEINSHTYDSLLSHTIHEGKIISNFNKGIMHKGSTSAYLLPGICISKFVGSYMGDTQLVDSFNVMIDDDELSQIYQLPKGCSLSIPVVVSNQTIKAINTIRLTQAELDKVLKIKNYIDKQILNIERYDNKRN